MSGSNLLLDSNIILYLLNGDKVLTEILKGKKLYVSFVSQLELLGYQDINLQERDNVQGFLDECVIIDINEEIKSEVIKLKQVSKIKLPDSIILATSIYLNTPLLTADKGFEKFKDVNVLKYIKS
jgi:predicted nucleic acid-binding protein